jgi:leucyl/phenylalanyl-tRNA--protein transferase
VRLHLDATAALDSAHRLLFSLCLRSHVIPWLDADAAFPPLACALRMPNGLLAAGGSLTVPRLLAAYRQGIFPWFSEGQPVLWWSPDPRMVLYTGEFRVHRSLAKVMRRRVFEVRFDTCFERVIRACAAPRRDADGTWITDEIIAAYCDLHAQGYAHSVESWSAGELVGGLYGVAIGRMFYGESMFAHAADASKVALVALVQHLRDCGFPLIDCQQETVHLASFGARPIAREVFARELTTLVNSNLEPGLWTQRVALLNTDDQAQ